MCSVIIKYIVKHSAWRSKNSPEKDKLEHNYWAEIIESNIGTLLFVIVALFFNTLWQLLLAALLPTLICYASGKLKEWSDGKGNGNKESEDIFFTTLPGTIKTIILIVVIIILK